MPTTNVGTATDEGLIGAPDHDVVAAATAAGRILISLDRGLGDIRAYPPGSHAGIVVLRLTDQSATAATKPVSDLATLTNPDSLPGPWRSCSAGCCVSAVGLHSRDAIDTLCSCLGPIDG